MIKFCRLGRFHQTFFAKQKVSLAQPTAKNAINFHQNYATSCAAKFSKNVSSNYVCHLPNVCSVRHSPLIKLIATFQFDLKTFDVNPSA